MKEFIPICLAVSLLWVMDVRAQTVNQGGLSGTLITAMGADTSPNGTGTVFYTTPSKGHFALTQVGNTTACSVQLEGGTALGGTYTPGLLLPANTPIVVIGVSTSATCFIIGVLAK
jgi:hypothetical protein